VWIGEIRGTMKANCARGHGACSDERGTWQRLERNTVGLVFCGSTQPTIGF